MPQIKRSGEPPVSSSIPETAILLVAFHRVPPPKESMKGVLRESLLVGKHSGSSQLRHSSWVTAGAIVVVSLRPDGGQASNLCGTAALLALRSCPAGDRSNRDCVLAKEVHLDLRLHFHRTALHLIRTVVPLANRAHAGFCQCAAATQYRHFFDRAVGANQGLQLQLPNQIALGIDRMSKVTLRKFRDKPRREGAIGAGPGIVSETVARGGTGEPPALIERPTPSATDADSGSPCALAFQGMVLRRPVKSKAD